MRAASSSPALPSIESSTTAMTRSSGALVPVDDDADVDRALAHAVEHLLDDAAEQIAAEHRTVIAEQQPADRRLRRELEDVAGGIVGPHRLRIDGARRPRAHDRSPASAPASAATPCDRSRAGPSGCRPPAAAPAPARAAADPPAASPPWPGRAATPARPDSRRARGARRRSAVTRPRASWPLVVELEAARDEVQERRGHERGHQRHQHQHREQRRRQHAQLEPDVEDDQLHQAARVHEHAERRRSRASRARSGAPRRAIRRTCPQRRRR